MKAQVFRVLASYPICPCVAGGIVLAGAVGLMLLPFHWLLLVPPLTPVMWFAAYVTEIRPWFREGDVCPGIVVCEDPLLVASLTDMTTDLSGTGKSYPAVKICREPRRRFTDAAAKRGSRVASIARYSGFPGLKPKHWDDFEPRAVQCATSNESEVARLLREIPQRRWNELQNALDNIPRPYRPGLYRLWEKRK